MNYDEMSFDELTARLSKEFYSQERNDIVIIKLMAELQSRIDNSSI